MKKIKFDDLCKEEPGKCYHISEKFTHLKGFVEEDYMALYVTNENKDANCIFLDNVTGEKLSIPVKDAKYLDYQKIES